MFSEHLLLALYVTAVMAWAAITATMLWRRSSCPQTVGDHRDLHVYELARLAGGRARVMESLWVNLLEQGVISLRPRRRRLTWWHGATPMIVACRDADPVGHALEQQLVDAVRKRPGERPIIVAYDAVACAAPELIEARLIADRLLFDDTRRRIVSGLGWSLFWLGAAWGTGKLIAEPAPRDLTGVIVAAMGMLVFFVALWAASGDRSVATRDGDGVVERERARCDPPLPARTPGDLALAVALFGMSALDHIDVLGAHGAEARHLQAYLDFESQQMI